MSNRSSESTRWGFIGAGQMATALARGMLRAGVATPDSVWASDPDEATRAKLTKESAIATFASNREVIERSNAIVLAVKPQAMPEVLAEIDPLLTHEHLIISIAAGVTLAVLERGLGSGRRVVRVIPNTPALVGAGASAYCMGTAAEPGDEAIVRSCLASVGIAVRVPESSLDAVTGLSGSGPAFVYVIIEALADGGVRMGLPREVAVSLAAQTVLGSAKMVVETGLHTGMLKDQVTSPGGTTIAGLHALERAGLRGALMDAVEAATRRAVELAKATPS